MVSSIIPKNKRSSLSWASSLLRIVTFIILWENWWDHIMLLRFPLTFRAQSRLLNHSDLANFYGLWPISGRRRVYLGIVGCMGFNNLSFDSLQLYNKRISFYKFNSMKFMLSRHCWVRRQWHFAIKWCVCMRILTLYVEYTLLFMQCMLLTIRIW